MRNTWTIALGDPELFLANLHGLAQEFKSMAGVQRCGLEEIRAFVKSRNFELTNEPEVFRATVAAFAAMLINDHSQQLRIRGLLSKKLFIESAGFKCDLLELFHRCVFEGMDLLS